MRKLITILFVIFCQVSIGQVYQIMPQYGYSTPRFNTDSTLQLPTFNGTPSLKSNKTNKGAIAIDSTNGRFYFYNPKTSAWNQVSGGSTDTTSLSNRINLKLNISDTTNKFVSNVSKFDDSTITIFKGNTQTNITLSPSTTVTSATRLITQVYNNTGSTITKGSVIYINGRHSSNLPTIALSQANTELNSYSTFALVQNDIATSSSGYVIQAGQITNLNLPTSTYTDGQIVYLSPSVAGGITTTKPYAPNHIVKIGTITRAHPTLGTIELKIENGWQLDEMSDVAIAAVPIDSTILQFSRIDSLWHDVNPTTAMGNRFVKTIDSATMLLPYLRKNDSTIYYTKYRSDSSRINIYSTLNGKLLISDTSTMLSKYLRKTDTASISSRIDTKLAITDTSVFQRKSLASYSFQANKTNATANATANSFIDTSGTYTPGTTGTITWTGTAPTNLTSGIFKYTQIGKMCTISITLLYGTAGASTTSAEIQIPTICATPDQPNFTTTNDFLYCGYGLIFAGKAMSSTSPNAARACYLKKTASGQPTLVVTSSLGTAVTFVSGTVTYYTN